MWNIRGKSILPIALTEKKLFLPAILAVYTLLTRLFFHGPVYFIDGSNHIRCILEKVYVIQPPGYWLFNRIAGLFSDPVLAISVMNILFSVAGIVVFYYTALFFAGRTSAFIAALAYSSIFYIWFSGEIHSTYASQIFFPISLFCVLLHYERDRASWKLWLAAAIFAAGAGLRPTDGVFLLPMLVYYSAIRLPRFKAVLFLVLSLVLCLAWVIPTGWAYSQAVGRVPGFDQSAGGAQDITHYLQWAMTQRSITTSINIYSIANIIRYIVPLLVAFFPIMVAAMMNLARNWKDWRVQLILSWIVPGSLFFILSFMGCAPYLNFLSAGILLLALGAPRMMAVTAAWNTILFLSVVPIPSHRLAVNVWNCYVVEYSRYGVQHQWSPLLLHIQNDASHNTGN